MKTKLKRAISLLLISLMCFSTMGTQVYAASPNLTLYDDEVIDGTEIEAENNAEDESDVTDDSSSDITEDNASDSNVEDAANDNENANDAEVSDGATDDTAESVSTNEIDPDTVTEDEVETSKVYVGNGYEITFEVYASWDTGSNAGITIKNTGDKVIENWSLTMVFDNDISSIYNASIISNADGKYEIKNAVWNQDIDINSTITFGISSSMPMTVLPTSMTLISAGSNTKSVEDISIEYKFDSQWDNGGQGSITITNNTDTDIEDWSLEFDFDGEEVTFWNAAIVSKDGNHFVLHNSGYNSILYAGSTLSIGFLVSNYSGTYEITNLKLTVASDDADVVIDDIEDAPLIDIGENYFRQPSADEIVFDDEIGRYVRDELLVTAYLGVPKEAIVEMADEVGADIVGRIELTGDYQFKFREAQTIDSLEEITEYLYGYPYIKFISLNTVSSVDIDFESNDTVYSDGLQYEKNDYYNSDNEYVYSYVTAKTQAESWNEASPYGDNWNLEKLHVPSAWDLVPANTQPVKVGIFDTYFSDVTIDKNVELHYNSILSNHPNYDGKTDYNYFAHGNNVAGIIGAKHNNLCGISGVATNVQLYAYTMYVDKNSQTIMGAKSGLTSLIGNQVKVINMSVGYSNKGLVYAASHNNRTAQMVVENDANIMAMHLKTFLDLGYDFVIVQSAGNERDKSFVPCSDEGHYGYHKYDSSKDDASKIVSGGTEARYGFFISAIEDPEVIDHIIVVGAAKNYVNTFDDTDFTNVGDRVDVYAPGQNILSLAPIDWNYNDVLGDNPIKGYSIMSGTSQAAPHISGIAALMYQVKPSISAYRVKTIICDPANQVGCVLDPGTSQPVPMPDASICVQKAKNIIDTTAFDVDWPMGTLSGSVTNVEKNEHINNVSIQAIWNNTGDYNVCPDMYAKNFITDTEGAYSVPLPAGVYDILFYVNDGTRNYLPVVIKDVHIEPNETTYLENIKMTAWIANTSGSVKGIVKDAITGKDVSGATIKLRAGWNNTSGAYVTTLTKKTRSATSDTDGTFSISAPIGAYTAEIVKDGYITGYMNVVSTGSSTAISGYDFSMSLSPVLPDDEYRIVLTWGAVPRDLDSHLTYYKNGVQQFHVYYGSKSAYLGGELVAKLDLDDTTSYGPETVTITVSEDLLKDGELRYCVHNFSGGYDKLSQSEAAVHIYKGNEHLKTYHVTQNQSGLVWHVFNLNSSGLEMKNTYDSTIN